MSIVSGAETPKSIRIDLDEVQGRKIVYGFSYVQNVGQGASSNVWFAPDLASDIERRIRLGDGKVLEEFGVDWATVQQYEFMQERRQTYPMDVTNFKLSYYFLQRMRAGGVRVVVITMGKYTNPAMGDEMEIMDQHIKRAIAETLNVIYLEEESASATKELDDLRHKSLWRAAEVIPHVIMSIGAKKLFKPARATNTTTNFFKILDMLPQKHIQHNVWIGLELPTLRGKNERCLVRPDELSIHGFQKAITDVFRGFDMWSVGKLNGNANAGTETLATIRHARGYGDRGNSSARQMASYFVRDCTPEGNAA